MQGTENRTDQEKKSPGQEKKNPGEIRHSSCAMGHSKLLVLDMHVLFGTKMFALLLGSMVFCIVNAKHVELLRQYGFDLRVEKSCLSSLTGILLCCMCNLSCEFFTQKFCQRHLNLVVEMLVITTLIGV